LNRPGLCGVLSIFSSMRYLTGDLKSVDNLWMALSLLPFALFFDFMDGKVARWRKKSSMMGQELDSLADLVRNPIRLSIPSSTAPPTCAYLHVWSGPVLPDSIPNPLCRQAPND
jgi:hypothetical protein